MEKCNGKWTGRLNPASKTFLPDDTFFARCVLILRIMDLKPDMYTLSLKGSQTEKTGSGTRR